MTKETAGRTLRSGELAGLAGVSRDTLRHYERRGLLPLTQRSQNGYRRYSPETLTRVWLIRGALGIGFTVEELREILLGKAKAARLLHHNLVFDFLELFG